MTYDPQTPMPDAFKRARDADTLERMMDEAETSLDFAVDIPDVTNEEWISVGYFATRNEAITYAQQRFGADEEGRVNLVSRMPSDD